MLDVLSQNVLMKINLIFVIASLLVLFFSHRLYKRVGRRCRRKECGRLFVKRACKILLPPDQVVSFYSRQGEKRKLRWFIRRPVKLTFSSCRCRWVELVKIDLDPISVWHAYWVKWFHKRQYYLEESDLVEAAQRKLRQLYHKGSRYESLDAQATDTPPISLNTLFRDCFEELEGLVDANLPPAPIP